MVEKEGYYERLKKQDFAIPVVGLNKMPPESTQFWLKEIGKKHKIGIYKDGFCRYIGMGHNIYIFAEDYDEGKLIALGTREKRPSLEQLKLVTKRGAVVLVDVEMGGISVWETE